MRIHILILLIFLSTAIFSDSLIIGYTQHCTVVNGGKAHKYHAHGRSGQITLSTYNHVNIYTPAGNDYVSIKSYNSGPNAGAKMIFKGDIYLQETYVVKINGRRIKKIERVYHSGLKRMVSKIYVYGNSVRYYIDGFIKCDGDAPSIDIDLTKTENWINTNEQGKYLHLTGDEIYYKKTNSLTNITLFYTGITDNGGTGVSFGYSSKSVPPYKYKQEILEQITVPGSGSKSFNIDVNNMSVRKGFGVYDKIENFNAAYVDFIEDSIPPLLSRIKVGSPQKDSQILFSDPGSNPKDGSVLRYNYIVKYSASDNESNLPSPAVGITCKVDNVPRKKKNEGGDLHIEGDNSSFTVDLPVYGRDKKYYINTSVIDNVSNESIILTDEVLVTAPAIIDDGGLLGNQNNPNSIQYVNGKKTFKGIIDVGNEVETGNGLSSVTIQLERDGIYQTAGTLQISDQIFKEKSTHKEFEFNTNVDALNLQQHKVYNIILTSIHRNSNRIIPNETIVYRGMSKVPTNVVNLVSPGLKFINYNENISLQADKCVLNGTGLGFLGNDETPTIFFNNEKGFYIPGRESATKVVLVKDAATGYHFAKIDYGFKYEKYKADKTILSNQDGVETYLISNYKFKLDQFLDVDELVIETMQDDVETRFFNREEILVRVDLREKNANEVSGIDKIIYFNYSGSDFPELSKDKNLADSIFNSTLAKNKTVHKIESEADLNKYVSFNLINSDDGTEVPRTICGKIVDRAGNYKYISLGNLLLDKKPPEDYSEEDFVYDYIKDDLKVTLGIDRDYILRVQDANDEYIYVPDNILIHDLVSGYVPNGEFTYSLQLVDKARNKTERVLTFYNPGSILSEDIQTSHSYDSIDGNILTFVKKGESGFFSGFQIKRVDEYGAEELVDNNIDKNLISHGEYTYNIYSINTSGWTNVKDSFVTDYNVVVKNNLPEISIDSTFVTKDDNIYLNSGFIVDYTRTDVDNDTLESEISIIDKESGTILSKNISDQSEFSLEGTFGSNYSVLEDNKSYSAEINVIDDWGSKRPVDIFSSKLSFDFTYDSTPPVFPEEDDYLIEQEEGYPNYNGDLYINLVDKGVGIDHSTVIATITSGAEEIKLSLIHDETIKDGYTHYLVLPEGQYKLVVNASDRLGNSDELINKSWITVDKQSPAITNIEWGDNNNLILDKNLLSTRNSNYLIEWSDNETAPFNLIYRFIDSSGSVVYSGIKRVDGFTSFPGDDFNVSLHNNYPLLADGAEYILEVEIVDHAGNKSLEYATEFTFKYDLEKPEIEVINWNIPLIDGVNYVTGSFTEPEYLIEDIVDKSIIPLYRLYSYDRAELTDEVDNIDNLPITIDGNYRLDLIARDESGHQSVKSIDFVYDTTPPDNITIHYPEGKKILYKGGEDLLISFSANSVDKFEYKLIDLNSGEDITPSWVEVSAGQASPYILTLPRDESLDSQTIMINLRAIDTPGNISDEIVPISGNISIDNTIETVNIHSSSWVSKTGRVSSVWEYRAAKDSDDSNISGYEYRLIRKRDGTESYITPFIETTERGFSYILSDEVLEDDIYYVEVKGLLASSRETSIFRSTGIFTDFISPVITYLDSPEYSTSSSILLDFNSRDNAGVSNSKAQLTWFYKEAEELKTRSSKVIDLGMVSDGLVELASGDISKELKQGYFVHIDLFIEDLAGNVTVKRSSPIVIDNTPTPGFIVIDEGDYINPVANETLGFDWNGSLDDPESPIVETKYQLTFSGVIDENDWIDYFSSSRSIDIDLPEEFKDISNNGRTAVIAVKKVNASGLETVGFSNGITLDSTAGMLDKARFIEGSDESELLFYTNNLNLTLKVYGEDAQSGITRISGELGEYIHGEWVNYLDNSFNFDTTTSTVDIKLPDNFPVNKRFSYKLKWINGTGEESEPIFTRDLVYAPFKPEVLDAAATYWDNKITIGWDSILSIPFVRGKITLYSDTLTKEYILDENLGKYTISTADLPDDEYYAEIVLTDVSDKDSDSVKSNSFAVDRRAPVTTDFIADSHVSYSLDFSLELDEPVTKYSFSIRNVNSGELWNYKGTAGNRVSIEDLVLRDFVNIDDLHNSFIELKLTSGDIYGNWSEVESALVKVDLTEPTASDLTIDRIRRFHGKDIELDRAISFSRKEIENVLFKSKDIESPVIGYEYAVLENHDDNIQSGDWSILQDIDDIGNYRVSIPESSLESRSLYIALRTLNKADLYSEPVVSDEIFIDLDPPEILFDMVDEVGKSYISGEDVSTYNYDGIVKIDTINEFTNNAYSKVKVYDPENKLTKSFEGHTDSLKSYLATLFVEDIELYGIYRIEVDIEDPGYNSSTSTTKLRYNSPPFSRAPEEIVLNPLRPLDKDIAEWFTDSDGVKEVNYKISDGETLLFSGNDIESVQFTLPHKEIWDQESIYTLEIEAYDNFNKPRIVKFPLKVVNTSEGQLYTDEYWRGDHYLTGDVTVPDSLKLTIDNNSRVISDQDLKYRGEHQLIVDGLLEHLGSVQYSDNSNAFNWGGIIINGDAILDNTSIDGAVTGLQIDSSNNLDINNLSISNCIIGIHLLNGSLSLSNSEITGNKHYGIKEEDGVDITVTDTYFNLNGYDYYDTELTVIDTETLNSLGNNSGNRGE